MGPPRLELGSPPPQDGRITRLPHGPPTKSKQKDIKILRMGFGGDVSVVTGLWGTNLLYQ